MNQNVAEFVIVQRGAISSQIAAILRKSIFTGEYDPGDRLPPEREIAERFGISRVTVRQALQSLAGEGWIEIVQGRGATVLDFSRNVGLDVLPSLLASCPRDVISPETFLSVYDFADWLYRQLYTSAAQHAQISDEKVLMDIISEYKEGISARDYCGLEEALGRGLLRIGNNLVLRMFFNTYIKTFHYLVDTEILPLPPLPRELYMSYYGDLIRAVCRRDTAQINNIIDTYRTVVRSAISHYFTQAGLDAGEPG